jgi:hypothetical protein
LPTRGCAIQISKPLQNALIAFTFHGFGTRWLLREPLGPRLYRENVAAVSATIVAVLASLALAAPGWRWTWALASFLIGHFGWGTYLAARIYARARTAERTSEA